MLLAGDADAADLAGRQGGPVQRHAHGRDHSIDPALRMSFAGAAVALDQTMDGVSATAPAPAIVHDNSLGPLRFAVDSDKHCAFPPMCACRILFDDAGSENLLSARNADGVLPISRLKFRLKVDRVSYPTSRPIVVILNSVSTKS
jgi:hypothetical protein